MTLRERLEALLAALPSGASVTLSRRDLEGLLGHEEPQDIEHEAREALADLTVEEAGAQLGRAGSTIRTWCASGRIPGAYRLHGREWRIPRASLRRYLDTQARREDGGSDPGPVDLGRWRRHFPRRGG